MMNATIHAIEDGTAKNLAAFERIFVRESESRSVLAGYGVVSTVVPDLTVQAQAPRTDRRRGICATDSVVANSSQAVRALCREKGYPYCSMVCVPKSDSIPHPAASDYIDELCKWISSHELIITGRFHIVTLCIVTEPPFLAVESNTPKISSFVKDVFGDLRRVVDPAILSELDLPAFSFWRPAEKDALERTWKNSQASTFEMFDAIRKDIELAR